MSGSNAPEICGKNDSAASNKSLVSSLRQELRQRRDHTSRRFKKSLLIGANAVQAIRMLENLEAVAAAKSTKNEDVTELHALISEYRQKISSAIATGNDEIILDVQGRVEELTLGNDPLYLEGEEERKRQYLARKKEEAIRTPTWTQNPSHRFINLLRGDFEGREEVTEAEQRSCISRCAWGVAILGLIVALSFSVVDFWSAQANPALSTQMFHNERLEMPIMLGCMTFPMIPSFDGFPNENYSGNPLWGLRSYSNGETGEEYLYPKTRELITEATFLGPKEVCNDALRYFSLKAISSGLDSVFDPTTRCYSCLRIGRKRPISLSYKSSLKRAAGAVTVEFATSRDVDFCFDPLQVVDSVRRESIRDMLKTHGDQLIERGVVKIVNNTDINVSIQYALEYGFEAFSTATPGDDRPRIAAEASVYCNLYLFSGYFFPVKPGTEVRYIYDAPAGVNSWQPVGDQDNFLQIEPEKTDKVSFMGNRSDVLNDLREPSRSKTWRQTANGVNLYALHSNERAHPAFQDFAANLRPEHRDVLLFTMKIESGVSRYSTSVQHGARKTFRAAARFRRFNISLDFATFETEVVTRRPVTSVAEFFTDVFEYIGLFTGVCAYSVLVGPARMFLKRSNTQRH